MYYNINTYSNMELLLTSALVYATGHLLKNTQKTADTIDTKNPNETPNGENIYNSNVVESANKKLLDLSLQKYADAEHPEITGVIPPLFNSRNVINTVKPMNLQAFNEKTPIVSSMTLQNRPMFNGLASKGVLSSVDSDKFSSFGENQSGISQLSGRAFEATHGNMTPFFRGNSTQVVYENLENTSKLTTFTGTSNDETYIQKNEQKPMFEMQRQNIFGTPVSIDKSRYIASQFNQGVPLTEPEKVAAPRAQTIYNPLNQLPFGKTLDELRQGSNVKETYAGRVFGSDFGSVRGVLGNVEKRTGDSTREQFVDDIYGTPNGAKTVPTSDYNYDNMKIPVRTEFNTEYYGTSDAPNHLTGFTQRIGTDPFDSLFQESTKEVSGGYIPNVSTKMPMDDDNYGIETFSAYETDRGTYTERVAPAKAHTNTTTQRTTDNAKTTMRANKAKNNGIITGTQKGGYDRKVNGVEMKTTHKETLVNSTKHNLGQAQVQSHGGLGYTVTAIGKKARATHRQTTTKSHTGIATSTKAPKSVLVAKNHIKKRYAIHPEYSGDATKTNGEYNREQFKNARISDRKEKTLAGRRANGKHDNLPLGKASYGKVCRKQPTQSREQQIASGINSNTTKTYQSIVNTTMAGVNTKATVKRGIEDSRINIDSDTIKNVDNPLVIKTNFY